MEASAVQTRTATRHPRSTSLEPRLDPLLSAPVVSSELDVSRERPLPQIGRGRCVAVLAVHHVHTGGQILTGGAEKYVCDAIEALLAAGARVHVGYSGVSVYGDLLERYGPDRLTVEHVGWVDERLSGDDRFGFGRLRERRRWLRATHADTLFIIQQASGAAFFTSLIAARTLGLRVVSSIRQMAPHATENGRAISWPAAMLRSSVRRRLLPARCCDAVIFNSARVSQDYLRGFAFPAARAHVILNGHRGGAAVRRRRSAPPVIGVVGRVSKEKGCDIALEAFARVAGRHRAARLVYIGDGPLASILEERAAALGIADRVQFAGYVADRERVYAAMDVCVQASRRESMANTVIEAMARGIPCVVSDVGGLPEAVRDGETGIVFRDGDVEACAGAIERLLGEEGVWAAYSSAAAGHARQVFSWERFAGQTARAVLG